MKLNVLNNGQMLTFGYNLKLSSSKQQGIEGVIRYHSDKLLETDRLGHKAYLEAITDFKNKRFDATELFEYYGKKIKKYDEATYEKWVKFFDSLATEYVKVSDDKNKKSFFKFFSRKKSSQNIDKKDYSKINVDVTDHNGGGVSMACFFPLISPEVRIKIGDVAWYYNLKDDMNNNSYMEGAFSSADRIYEFMNDIDNSVKYLIDNEGKRLVGDAKFEVEWQKKQEKELEHIAESNKIMDTLEA